MATYKIKSGDTFDIYDNDRKVGKITKVIAFENI